MILQCVRWYVAYSLIVVYCDFNKFATEQVFASMEEVLAPYYRDGALNLPGAIWFVTATTD